MRRLSWLLGGFSQCSSAPCKSEDAHTFVTVPCCNVTLPGGPYSLTGPHACIVTSLFIKKKRSIQKVQYFPCVLESMEDLGDRLPESCSRRVIHGDFSTVWID